MVVAVVHLPDAGFRLVGRLHRTLFDLTRGRVAGSMGGMPVVKLSTVGRRSGQRRDTMLTAPVHSEERVVLVASKGGAAGHPSWYVNLREHPDVTLTLSGRTRSMVARTASAEEKAELWPAIVSAYRGYAGYQERTTRDIPVVICEPAPRPTS